MEQTEILELEKIVEKTHLFKGAEDSPLLAPRGVFLVDNKLFVAVIPVLIIIIPIVFDVILVKIARGNSIIIGVIVVTPSSVSR